MRNPASASTSKTPCCTKVGLKRGPWTPEEDELLANYVKREGEGRWRTLPKRAGLLRCGKSCRLRWMNYLRPSVKRGQIAPDEEDLILRLHRLLGNRCCLYHFFLVWNLPQILTYWCISLFLKFLRHFFDFQVVSDCRKDPGAYRQWDQELLEHPSQQETHQPRNRSQNPQATKP